jgi:hypothetical protein
VAPLVYALKSPDQAEIFGQLLIFGIVSLYRNVRRCYLERSGDSTRTPEKLSSLMALHGLTVELV